MSNENTPVQNAAPTAVATATAPTPAERFVNQLSKELTALAPGEIVSDFQRRLGLNYFTKIDQTLKDLEKKRLAKNEQYREAIPYTWNSVNMQKLALDVVAFTKIGLDPLQPNHINLIPYANNAQGRYDIGFIPGYRGMEIKAKKYGYDVPDEVIVELVYSTDKFKQHKRDKDNHIESYEFEVVNDFDRGEIIGGFYYFSYKDNPTKNRIKVMTMADIMKRQPKKASVEFWGGTKDVWENGKKVGKEEIPGWKEEMCWKTIFRAAYNSITIDSSKIDDAFRRMIEIENDSNIQAIEQEIDENANKGEKLSLVPDEPTVIEVQATSEQQPQPARVEEHKSPTEPNCNISTAGGWYRVSGNPKSPTEPNVPF